MKEGRKERKDGRMEGWKDGRGKVGGRRNEGRKEGRKERKEGRTEGLEGRMKG